MQKHTEENINSEASDKGLDVIKWLTILIRLDFFDEITGRFGLFLHNVGSFKYEIIFYDFFIL